ncbi:hypothetical protein [Tenacibaculum aquimarinum]|uniref:hypothetical protein n=1 Tax=Tenacibaculum aquimarinum TaxID=2910675 RepID=UPI001F0B27A9|nr:hypothetical protein [Tenacibaculum aquimarinum]MCH3885908.1 hypothetical protein [Tenacibaculum aquimarinum]
MKKITLILSALVIFISCKETKSVTSQNKSNVVEKAQATIDSVMVRKHLYTLASDEMEGRGTGTPE